MKIINLSAALIAAGLLISGSAFAQTPSATTTAQKQKTQEGGPTFAPMPCSGPENANSKADPNCKQRTQNLSPSPATANASPK